MAELLYAYTTGDDNNRTITDYPSWETSSHCDLPAGFYTITSVKVYIFGTATSGTIYAKIWTLGDISSGEGSMVFSEELSLGWYEISIPNSPVASKWASVSLSKTIPSGNALWRINDGTPNLYLVEIWGTVVLPPGKAQNPTPTDDQEDIKLTGIDQLKNLQWEAPA